MDDLIFPGDYYGPDEIVGTYGTQKRVLFLLPTHKGKDMFDCPDEHSGLHGVYEPPWKFRECGDGSLEIRESIGCGAKPYYWHGFLDEGNTWRQLDA